MHHVATILESTGIPSEPKEIFESMGISEPSTENMDWSAVFTSTLLHYLRKRYTEATEIYGTTEPQIEVARFSDGVYIILDGKKIRKMTQDEINLISPMANRNSVTIPLSPMPKSLSNSTTAFTQLSADIGCENPKMQSPNLIKGTLSEEDTMKLVQKKAMIEKNGRYEGW